MLIVASCGAPVAGRSTSGESDTAATTATNVAPPVTGGAEADTFPSTTVPDAQNIAWLYPTGDLPAWRLAEISRTQASDCEPPEADCIFTEPHATLRFDGADQSYSHWLSILESLPSQPRIDAPPGAIERAVGDLSVDVLEQDGPQPLWASWIEPTGIVVELQAFKVPWDDVVAIIASLEPLDPAAWPTPTPPPPPTCDDRQQHIAPTLIPDGWQRFVLHAEATGACDPPVLMMSLVLPGTSAGPGRLVTIMVGGLGAAIGSPEAVVIGGRAGQLIRGQMADGTSTLNFDTTVEGVGINLHGTVDEQQLDPIVASIRHLDDAEWADLVESVSTSP
jgi:hypothetical protein